MISAKPSATRRLFGLLRAALPDFSRVSLFIAPARLAKPATPSDAEGRRRLVLGAGRVVVVREPPPRPK